MYRIARLFVLATALALVTAVASAQPPQWTPTIAPPNPLYAMTPYRYQINIGASIPTVFGRTFVGATAPFTPAPQLFSPNHGRMVSGPVWAPNSRTSMGYMYGGSVSNNGALTAGQRDFEKAQKAVGQQRNQLDAAKKAINDQWVYEKTGAVEVPGVKPGADPADALPRALAGADEGELLSGEALNHILTATLAAEAKGAKAVSAYLPPRLLDEVRFGTQAGDALNLVRQWNKLPFPAAFDAPELLDLRDTLERDFAAVAVPLLAGKPIDPAKLLKLEQTLKRVDEAAPAVIRNLSFEDAIASRRFLNQFANGVRALKVPANVGLVSSTWATEGANVAELVKHMAKYKLQFSAAPRGSDSAYFALHRAMATYYFVLTQPKK